MKKKVLSLHLLASLCMATSANAQYEKSAQSETTPPSLLTLGIGHYDALDDHEGVDFRMEYRAGKNIWLENLKPWIGAEVTSHGTLWIGGGALYDYSFSPHWYLTPSLGGGVYNKGSSDVDLDYPIQFRSQLELSYAFANQSRIGVSISHISNGGLGDSNPGAEVVNVQYSLPVNSLFSK
jgi:lipid A 3-O-deacylase